LVHSLDFLPKKRIKIYFSPLGFFSFSLIISHRVYVSKKRKRKNICSLNIEFRIDYIILSLKKRDFLLFLITVVIKVKKNVSLFSLFSIFQNYAWSDSCGVMIRWQPTYGSIESFSLNKKKRMKLWDVRNEKKEKSDKQKEKRRKEIKNQAVLEKKVKKEMEQKE